MVFKCKMCDASLNIKEGDSITTCEYCGTTQTVPLMNNQRIANLYNRADHYRKNNEYDKALVLYEEILNENSTDAEAYWSIILCRYGIEYVEDAATDKRVPTVNRMQLTSVFDDENYKAALKYAKESQKAVYEKEAASINEIQKGILEISAKEESFDIFICYKETDERGRRTMDSVLATDIYDKLTDAGYKVFFSRVTLDDKFGMAYEPYIFAALQSSKIMIVVGTKPEYYNAVWVRNEWSRYLSLIKKGAKKTLIPVYKDMNPYDMPEEFAHLQAVNMGELGFYQDLLHGIRKILGADRTEQKDIGLLVAANVQGLLDRAYLYMETADWDDADACVENALNIEPRNGECYLAKLMITLRVTHKENLGKTDILFNEDPNYLRVMRFGNEEQKAFVQTALDEVIATQGEKEYREVIQIMASSIDPDMLENCVVRLENLGDYGDATVKAEECREKVKTARERKREDQYNYYKPFAESDDEEKWARALAFYESNIGYKESDKYANLCRTKLAKEAEEDKVLQETAVAVEQSIERNSRIRQRQDRIRNAISVQDWLALIGIGFAGIVVLIYWVINF